LAAPRPLNGKALGGLSMNDLRRALKVGTGIFGLLMIVGLIGAYLDDESAPHWLVIPLWWAFQGAVLPGLAVRWLLGLPKDAPRWLDILEAAVFFCSGVFAWSVPVWAGLSLWRRGHAGTKPNRQA
jgi:hypothetical protein